MNLHGGYLDSQLSMEDQESEIHLDVKVNDRNILETRTDRQAHTTRDREAQGVVF